jgi:uncharacterized protein YbjT (DUF2867 family)
MVRRDVFVTGGTGYVGQHLIPMLLGRGHRVRVLARSASMHRVPAGATPIEGNALDEASVSAALRPGDTVVHLVGAPHPSPLKREAFQRVDLASIRALVAASRRVSIAHLVYVSVAQPAPIMRAYLEVRAEGERLIREAALTATVLRPWYVLGPGHRWPSVLVPLYRIAEMVPSMRAGARRLGLVTVAEFVIALRHAVENPPPARIIRLVEVPEIRQSMAAFRTV